MSTANIEDLFDENRLPQGAGLLAFVLYFPFGVVISLLRIFIGFHTYIISSILPRIALRSYILRCMCAVLGIWVNHDGVENRDPKVKVLVSNYTSSLDHLALELVTPNILPSVWDLPPLLMWFLGYKDLGAKQGRAKLIENSKKHCQKSSVPLLSFPEGASTNGRTGLLKFSVWPFSLDHPVQPMVIKLSRPSFANVAPSVLGGRWWLDIFWFLFVPYTTFNISTLHPMSIREETPEEFTKRVQIQMCQALHLQVTPHTSADKVEFAKRKLISHQQEQATRAAPPDPLVQMALQVQEVLPHVPVDNIKADLALTKDIDLTITNILEGRVQYVAMEPGVEASPAANVNVPNQLATSASTSKSPSMKSSEPVTFSRNPQNRHLSLADRKAMLIEGARQRYIEKHGLN